MRNYFSLFTIGHSETEIVGTNVAEEEIAGVDLPVEITPEVDLVEAEVETLVSAVILLRTNNPESVSVSRDGI